MTQADQKRRVVVTGVGMVAPNGIGIDKFWESITKGESGIGYISLFDSTEHTCKIAGEVKDFEPGDYMDPKEAKRMDRYCQLAMAAAKLCYEDSGLKEGEHVITGPYKILRHLKDGEAIEVKASDDKDDAKKTAEAKDAQ